MTKFSFSHLADRVHFILGEDDINGHESHPLFSEMAELHINNEELEWRETARYVFYQMFH